MSEVPDRAGQVEVRGLPIVWHEWGDEAAPVALCVHGFLDHGQSFAPVGAALRGELRVIAPDMRGHGASGWVGDGGYYHFYDYFDDLRRVLEALGVERLLLLGHSMGGSVATGLAALLGERVRGLVLLEGMGPPYADLSQTRLRLERWSLALGQPPVDGDPAHRRRHRSPMSSVEVAADKLRRVNPRLGPRRALALATTFTEPMGEGVVWRFDPLHRTPAAKPFVPDEARALWRAVTAPTLSLYGALGFTFDGLEGRHRELGRVVAGRVPEVGHNIHHERPELVVDALLTMHRGQPSLPPGVEPLERSG